MSYLFEAYDDRRSARRVPVGFYVSTFIDDEPERFFATSLSATGIFVEHVGPSPTSADRRLQIELPLPASTDTLWIRGDVVYDRDDPLFPGHAIHFTSMANKHRRLLREWVMDLRRRTLETEVVQADAVQITRPR